MERCPLCRARLREEALCPRCGADLSVPLEVERNALQAARRAMVSLAAGDLEIATGHAEMAAWLHGTAFHLGLYGFLRQLGEERTPAPGA